MNGRFRRHLTQQIVLTLWGMLTFVLFFCVVLLARQLMRQGGAPLDFARQPANLSAPPVETLGSAETREIVLYFADPLARRLAPETRSIEISEFTVENCRQALQALADGPQEDLVPIMPKGTAIRALYLLDGGELAVDFPAGLESALKQYRCASLEALFLYGVVDTLTQPALQGAKDGPVNRVRVLVDGSPPREAFPVHLDASGALDPDLQWLAEGAEEPAPAGQG